MGDRGAGDKRGSQLQDEQVPTNVGWEDGQACVRALLAGPPTCKDLMPDLRRS